MGTIRVAGLDTSLCRTGVAVLACTPENRWTVHTFDVPTASRVGDTERDKLERMDYIVSTVASVMADMDAVALEGLAFGAPGRATRDLAGLWWLAYRRLARLEVPVVIIAPTQAKAYATGSGRADKRDMSRAALRMWPEHETSSGDQDDALILASIVAELSGLPVPFDQPDYRRDALGRVPRPEDLPEFS